MTLKRWCSRYSFFKHLHCERVTLAVAAAWTSARDCGEAPDCNAHARVGLRPPARPRPAFAPTKRSGRARKGKMAFWVGGRGLVVCRGVVPLACQLKKIISTRTPLIRIVSKLSTIMFHVKMLAYMLVFRSAVKTIYVGKHAMNQHSYINYIM
jgi:hypothetical protein